ncbi:helix-hairpin-helix domain-containing protein [Adlercreutzia sp. ZJ154]|uniref:ComEA family DNA-binding protein n=1 Tax=Adlercreutzia sp. ZJ154 TaxID=2709790 RepID=UPI0013ED4040|nr:helix-hairpin-helix domain-containing protein [Adlercreutzia sp. ZJ154]
MQSSKVNINTADAAQLQTISGIGESKAKKIIAYRESNGKFKSVEDLTNVSGIGEKTLESIRDQICV